MSPHNPLTATVQKACGDHTATVFFLHGLGDSGDGWAPVTKQMSSLLPHVKFVLPNAPIRPVTLNFGMAMPAWFDIKSLDNVDQREDEVGLLQSSSDVLDLVQEEINSGIPASRIVIGGFSQGSAMALLSGLTIKQRVAGIVGLSGYLPLRTQIFAMASEENRNTPIFMAHGTQDKASVVQYRFATVSSKALDNAGYPVTFKAYAGMGHSSSPDEISDLVKFLKEVIPEAH